MILSCQTKNNSFPIENQTIYGINVYKLMDKLLDNNKNICNVLFYEFQCLLNLH